MVISEIFNKNVEALRENYADKGESFLSIADKAAKAAEEMADVTDICYPTQEQAVRWAAAFGEPVINRTFYLVGFSDGRFIRELLKVTNNTNMICVYEPSLSSFIYAANHYELWDVLSDERIILCIEGINGNSMFDIIFSTVSYINFRLIMMGVLPGYEKFGEAHGRIKKMLEYRMEMVQFEKVTDIELSENECRNILSNLPDVVRERRLNELIKTFENIDKEGRPAIIVSAGPSLDKNVKELAKAKNIGFIIVVDTALKAVLRAGIKPDITICIDPRKELVFFNHDEIKNIPAVFGMGITARVIDDHCGNRFYVGNDDGGIADMFSRCAFGDCYRTLNAGGSVANSAYSLAVALGFKTIILAGQDLAFTDGKGHTKDAYDDDEKNAKDASERADLCQVEAVNGGTVTTETRMRSYIQWFENNISSMPDIKVIDGTEGGALIHGSIVMSLKDAIAQECTGRDIDYDHIINSIPPAYDNEFQQEFTQYMKSINEKLDCVKEELQRGILAYQDLRKAIAARNGTAINAAMEAVKKANGLEDDEPLMSLVTKYAMRDKYEVREDLYDSNADDTEAAIRNGIRLLESYIRGIDKMKTETHLMTDKLICQQKPF